MKVTNGLKILSLVLCSTPAFANRVHLGDAVDMHQLIRSKNYDVVSVEATAQARTSESNPKSFGRWSRCYTRSLNVPPVPFQKYNYHPFMSDAVDVSEVVTAVVGRHAVHVDEGEISTLLSTLEGQVQNLTQSECAIESSVRVDVTVKLRESGELRKGYFFLQGKSSLQVAFAKWKSDFSEIGTITENLPNKTPVDLY